MKVTLVLFFVNALWLSGSLARNVCDMVPIELWGGSKVSHTDDLRTPVPIVVVTHTVTQGCYTDVDCERLARNIRNYHINQGKGDIGLSFMIGGNGKVYEGAGWKAGRHTLNYNDKSISLSYMGTFREELPTREALAAGRELLGCFLNTRYLDCDYKLVGHRQLSNTGSPGDALQRHIESWPHWSNYTSRY